MNPAPAIATPDLVPVRRALLSVSDKAGLVEFARALVDKYDVQLISTGGTAQALRDARIAVTDVSEVTGFPEILGGRVKTLHPKVHGGLLAVRDNPEHAQQMTTHEIAPIDLVVVNLYPFQEKVASGADRATCIENIDIGGPSMLRSAAKNSAYVTVVVNPNDYNAVLAELEKHQGKTSNDFRFTLAGAAFKATACYDTAIDAWYETQLKTVDQPA